MESAVVIFTVVGLYIISCAQCCTVSAPEVALSELHDGCYSHDRSRDPGCVAAMHRYCARVQVNGNSLLMLGTSREFINGRIGMSCVRAHWAGDVGIDELKHHHDGCSTVYVSQTAGCLSAIHRYCVSRFGQSYAGMSQEANSATNALGVRCFQSTRKESVRVDVLTQYVGGHCKYSASDVCFTAASRWCQSLGHSGGITQEVGNGRITVACYKAEYSGDAFTIRSQDFYNALKRVAVVCNLNFVIDHGKILNTSPEVLKEEFYDNKKSSVPLSSSFEVSKTVTETNSFTIDKSWTISAEATTTVKVPFVGKTGITVSSSYTRTLSLTKTNERSVVYTTTSDVTVPPYRAMIKKAVVTRANLEVPWTAMVVNGLGAIKTMQGQWHGVDTYDLKVTQLIRVGSRE